MPTYFKPLPPEVFPEQARPHIRRLNDFLRELGGMEGVMKNPLSSQRSDSSIVRRQDEQVHITRITPDVSSVVSGASTVTGTPALTYGLTNVAGSTTTAISTNASIRFPLSANTVWGLTNADVAAIPISAVASVAGVSLNTADDRQVLFNNAGAIGVDPDFVWSGTVLGVTGDISLTGAVGATGIVMAAGFSSAGGATFGSLSVSGGATFSGNVRLGSTMTVGTVNIDPITTNTGSIGRAVRRWGNIFGSTINATHYSSATGVATIAGMTVGTDVLVVDISGVTINSTLNFGGNFQGINSTVGWVPLTDVSIPLGLGGAAPLRWTRLHARHALWGKQVDAASGQTVHVTLAGNYANITGSVTVQGISYGDGADAVGGSTGSVQWLKLDSNPAISHDTTRLILAGGVTFYGATGDVIGLVNEGGNNFREIGRRQASLRSTSIILPPDASIPWSNMPTAEAEYAGSTEIRVYTDLSGYQYARMMLTLTNSVYGATGCILYLQYSTDGSAFSPLSIAGDSAPFVRGDIVGATVGPWVPIAPNARTDCYLRIMGVSGDGARDVAPISLMLELK